MREPHPVPPRPRPDRRPDSRPPKHHLPAAPPRGTLPRGCGLLALGAAVGLLLRADREPFFQPFDHAWEQAMDGSRTDAASALAVLLDRLGGPLGTVIPLALLGALCVYGRWRSGLFVLAAGVAASVLVALPLKHLVDRPHPPHPWVLVNDGSYPSGQVFTAAALTVAAGAVLFRPLRPPVALGGGTRRCRPSVGVTDGGLPRAELPAGGILQGAVEGGVPAFRAAPYAEPPVGALRWWPARPHPGWDGVRDATSDGPSAPQLHLEGGDPVLGGHGTPPFDDDCLTLKVWTPAGGRRRRPTRPGLVPRRRLPLGLRFPPHLLGRDLRPRRGPRRGERQLPHRTARLPLPGREGR